MNGIRNINHKELAGLTTPDHEIKYKTMERRIPTKCPNCNSKKLVQSRKQIEFVLGTKVYTRTLKCKECNFISILED